MININQVNFDWYELYVRPKYKANNKIQWADTEAWNPSLYKKKGDIIKKREPTKEYISEFVNFFKILKETNSCKYKVTKYQKEKYWKFPGIKNFSNLKIIAKNGIESVYTIELPKVSP